MLHPLPKFTFLNSYHTYAQSYLLMKIVPCEAYFINLINYLLIALLILSRFKENAFFFTVLVTIYICTVLSKQAVKLDPLVAEKTILFRWK